MGLSFDFSSGMQGAQAGASTGNPYAAAAGFVLGGFLGGRKKSAEKKKYKKKLKRWTATYNKLISPQHFQEIVQQYRPLYRELVAQGQGPQMQAQLEDTLARGGFTGTGIGAVGKAVSQSMPDVMALNQAYGAAGPQLEREIQAFANKAQMEGVGQIVGGTANPPYAISNPFGSASGAINALGAYGGMFKGMFGSGGSVATPSFGSQYGTMDFSKYSMGGGPGTSGAVAYPMSSIKNPIDYSNVYNPNYGKPMLPTLSTLGY